MRFEHDGFWYSIKAPQCHRWWPGMKPHWDGYVMIEEYSEDGEFMNSEKIGMPCSMADAEYWSDITALNVSIGWYPAMELGWELDHAD